MMARNTMHMQRAVDRVEERSGDVIQPSDLRRIAPTYLEGISLRGTFDFPIARYADWVLPSLVDGLSVNELRSA
ncbi:hypothetical protein [Caballeronia sp. KNU42]